MSDRIVCHVEDCTAAHLVPPYMSSERGLRFVFPHKGDRRYCYASPTDGGWCCGATCLQHCLVQTPGVHHKLLQVISHTLAPSAGEHRYMCPCFSSCWKLEIFLLSSSSLTSCLVTFASLFQEKLGSKDIASLTSLLALNLNQVRVRSFCRPLSAMCRTQVSLDVISWLR